MLRISSVVPLVLVAAALSACGDSDEGKKETSAPPPAAERESSSAGLTTKLEVDVSPAKPSAKDSPQGVSVEFTDIVGTETGAAPAPLTAVSFRARDGFELNAQYFPKCSIDDLRANQPGKCGKAKIGSGSARVLPPGKSPLDAPITLFNGEPKGGKPTFLYYVTAKGYRPLVGQAVISEEGGGLLVKGLPISGALPLTRFRETTLNATTTRTVNGKKTEVPFIAAPATCDGSWKFEVENTFKTGEKVTASSDVPCQG